jgi:hypothetical protein
MYVILTKLKLVQGLARLQRNWLCFVWASDHFSKNHNHNMTAVVIIHTSLLLSKKFNIPVEWKLVSSYVSGIKFIVVGHRACRWTTNWWLYSHSSWVNCSLMLKPTKNLSTSSSTIIHKCTSQLSFLLSFFLLLAISELRDEWALGHTLSSLQIGPCGTHL